MPFTDTHPRLAYRLEGASGPPVLLVMGFGMGGAVWRPQLEGLQQRLADMAGKRAPRETLRGHMRAVSLHRTEARLGRIRVPTLVVRPGRDVLVAPRNSDLLARAIPGARLVRFDDAGHGVTFQCAAALNDELERHFDRAS